MYRTTILALLMFCTALNLEAETITASVISSIPTIVHVGQPVSAKYSIPSTIAREDAIPTYRSTEDITIIQARIERPSTESRLPSNYSIVLIDYIAKHSGLITVPHLQLGSDTIVIPLINVTSSLREDSAEQMSIRLYLPWLELLELLIFFGMLLLSIYFTVLVIVWIIKHLRQTSYIFSNLANLWRCTRLLDGILYNLKRVGMKRSGKFLLSIDCYTLLLEVLQKRLIFFYSKNYILSLTIEEISKLIIQNSSMQMLATEDTKDLFEAMNKVLYGNIIFSINIRLNHCKQIKKILVHSFSFQKSLPQTSQDILGIFTGSSLPTSQLDKEGFDVY